MTVIRLLTELDAQLAPISRTSSFVLDLLDAGKLIRCSSTGAIVITVPANATVPIPVGSTFYARRVGTGGVSVAPESGSVTLNSVSNYRTLGRQFSPVTLTKVATDEWDMDGDLV